MYWQAERTLNKARRKPLKKRCASSTWMLDNTAIAAQALLPLVTQTAPPLAPP